MTEDRTLAATIFAVVMTPYRWHMQVVWHTILRVLLVLLLCWSINMSQRDMPYSPYHPSSCLQNSHKAEHVFSMTDTCDDHDGDGLCDLEDPCPEDPMNTCPLATPCPSQGNNASFEYIDHVIVATIDNESGSDQGYGDYRALHTVVDIASEVQISLSPGHTGASYPESWSVWIDLDQDGDFLDPEENLLTGTHLGTWDTLITIPQHAMPGATILRIAMQYNDIPLPCQDISYGEVEDYIIILHPGCDIGLPCDDGDLCTTDDQVSDDCICRGTYMDEDNDGYCAALDDDDQDPCVPADENCQPCTPMLTDDFEHDYGHWVDGGGDCSRVAAFASSGDYAIRLRDNEGPASSLTSHTINAELLDRLHVDFSFIAISMETNEGFVLEASPDGGAHYFLIKKWIAGEDFINGHTYDVPLVIDSYLSAETVLRFRSVASSNGDQVYIDDITIHQCTDTENLAPISLTQGHKIHQQDTVKSSPASNRKSLSVAKKSISVFPNPASETITIMMPDLHPQSSDIMTDHRSISVILWDLYSRCVLSTKYKIGDDNTIQLPLDHLPDGIYWLTVYCSEGHRYSKKIMIEN